MMDSDPAPDPMLLLARQVMAALGAGDPAEWTDLETALECVATCAEIARSTVESARCRQAEPDLFRAALSRLQRLDAVATVIAGWLDSHPIECARRELLEAAMMALHHDVLRLVDALMRAIDQREDLEASPWN